MVPYVAVASRYVALPPFAFFRDVSRSFWFFHDLPLSFAPLPPQAVQSALRTPKSAINMTPRSTSPRRLCASAGFHPICTLHSQLCIQHPPPPQGIQIRTPKSEVALHS